MLKLEKIDSQHGNNKCCIKLQVVIIHTAIWWLGWEQAAAIWWQWTGLDKLLLELLSGLYGKTYEKINKPQFVMHRGRSDGPKVCGKLSSLLVWLTNSVHLKVKTNHFYKYLQTNGFLKILN